MKKIIITCIMLTVLTVNGFGQKISNGSLNVLKGQKRVNIEVDFSLATIQGMDEENFAKYEVDWEKEKMRIIANFITEASTNCRNITIGSFSNTEYTFRVVVRKINPKGDWVSYARLVNEAGESFAIISGLDAFGGRIGSKMNLIDDGAKHTGALFGKFINKAIKKVK